MPVLNAFPEARSVPPSLASAQIVGFTLVSIPIGPIESSGTKLPTSWIERVGNGRGPNRERVTLQSESFGGELVGV